MYYLDNSATTKVSTKSAQKAVEIMTKKFGNPSSFHSMGFSAEKELRTAREIILNSLGGNGEIIFTSGGTESDNLAIFGAVEQNKRNGKRIVTSMIEHPAVLEPMKQLEQRGFEVIYLKPNEEGNIEKSQIYENITADTILVSLMSVNNETGAILPLEAVSPAIKRANSKAIFHCDNVQGYLKTNINPKKLCIDLMSISGHKVHAPKGVGALYISKNSKIKPIIFGGGQEKNLRSGTENMSSICAFGVAVGEYEKSTNIKEIHSFAKEELLKIDEIKINSPTNGSPYILNFSLGKIKGETMLHFLSQKEIYVSTGSACSGAKPSNVLYAMGFDKERIESSIRLSFCKDTVKEELEFFISALKEGISSLSHN